MKVGVGYINISRFDFEADREVEIRTYKLDKNDN